VAGQQLQVLELESPSSLVYILKFQLAFFEPGLGKNASFNSVTRFVQQRELGLRYERWQGACLLLNVTLTKAFTWMTVLCKGSCSFDFSRVASLSCKQPSAALLVFRESKAIYSRPPSGKHFGTRAMSEIQSMTRKSRTTPQ
jgi:hypothetical protein